MKPEVEEIMINREVERKLNNAENYLFELGKLADEMKGKYEFSAEVANVDKMRKLANDAKTEITNAKSKND
ncbi:MAG: hypothetical protein K9L17_01190 [Clostridiales bacterium]|nr:hypothetical protein [Clostridiales bacterium]MCF8021306.1 hypothetical protein [Clostridiales bacterium]